MRFWGRTLVRVDDELLAVAREAIGAHYELSPAQAARLRGSTRSEIEADARLMRTELGLPPLEDEQPRDEGGRFKGKSTMDRMIREAAGRTS
jgi:hypothetical protein